MSDPAAFIPGAQWVNLVSGGINVSAAIALPNASYLSPSLGNNGLTGPSDGAIIFLAGSAAEADGGQKWLMWNAASLEVADNVSVFNPWVVVGTPGRWQPATRGQQPGSRGAESAQAGNNGEFASASVLIGAPVSLVSNIAKTVTSILLQPGDWTVGGMVMFVPDATTTQTFTSGGINTVDNTMPTNFGTGANTARADGHNTGSATAGGVAGPTIVIPRIRMLLPAATTAYLIARSTFAVANNAAYGWITARRAR